MFTNKLFSLLFISGFLLLNPSYKSKVYGQTAISDRQINCYIVKPIPGDAQYYWPSSFEFSKGKASTYLDGLKDFAHIKSDTAVRYITSFEFKKHIFINFKCYKNLEEPDSIDL